MKKIIVFGLILSFFLLCFPVFADSFVPPMPSKIELEDGNKVFYMKPLRYYDDEYFSSDFYDSTGLPKDYLPSGLYYNTDPPELIYLISSHHTAKDFSYFDPHNVYLSNDGMHFAHIPIPLHNARETSAPAGTVLEFYESGNLIKRYHVSQLVKNDKKLSYSVSMVMWEDWEKRQFDAKNNLLSVTTVDGITYTFDITTGSIVDNENFNKNNNTNNNTNNNNDSGANNNNDRSNNKFGIIILIIGVIACVLTLAFFAIRKYKLR